MTLPWSLILKKTLFCNQVSVYSSWWNFAGFLRFTSKDQRDKCLKNPNTQNFVWRADSRTLIGVLYFYQAGYCSFHDAFPLQHAKAPTTNVLSVKGRNARWLQIRLRQMSIILETVYNCSLPTNTTQTRVWFQLFPNCSNRLIERDWLYSEISVLKHFTLNARNTDKRKETFGNLSQMNNG